MTQVERAPTDRRSGKDRRKLFRLSRFLPKSREDGLERRREGERRSKSERRSGWIRINRWASVQLERLKIAKFLKKN
jgi:hypothetical protein